MLSRTKISRILNFSIRTVMSKTALVCLAPGAEEMEFVIASDVLRRAGISVTVAGLSEEPVKCSRDVVIVPDTSLEKVKANKYDVVVLPGGLGGSQSLAESTLVGEILKQQEQENRIIGAICAAPALVFPAFGIGKGKSLTSYPSFKSKLESDYKYIDDQKVVQDGNLITSRGPGTAFDFGLKIAEALAGPEKAAEVAKAMLL
ncbi:dj-1beta [Haematobia irritans]|uniref:Putative transcriptional regulator dj-1 n=1 Tax=Haematobia irritans TaxID=7368 RepID=A0A1L8EBB6_HAEIR